VPDISILDPAVHAAPKGYLIKGAQEIVLKGVSGTFDGTGAAGPFVPAVQVVDPSGFVVGTYIADSAVVAGGSADVSWFPGVNAATGGTTGLGVWNYATPIAPASAQPGWVAGVPFLNSWLNTQLADGTYNPLRYRSVADGVQLLGAIAGGSQGSPIVALPGAYIPPFDIVGTVGSVVGNVAFQIGINALSGSVTVLGGGGPRITVATGVITGNVTTTGTTFGTGTDVLASALTFVADGASNYLVTLYAIAWSEDSSNSVLLHLNLDAVDAGLCTGASLPGAGFDMVGFASAYLPAPSAGTHTVNLRMLVSAGTGTLQANTSRPGLVTIERLP
jgi:hypothetical protein